MFRVFLFPVVVIASFFLSAQLTHAAPSCQPVMIESKDKVRSATIELWELDGDKVKQSEKVKPINVSGQKFPITLLDCGDPEHLFWQRPEGPFMVKKAKFLCLAVKTNATSAAAKDTAGAPGSGSTNSEC